MNVIGFCVLCFLGGAVVTAVFFATCNKEYADGWKAGYQQAEREYHQRQNEVRAARLEAEINFRNAALMGQNDGYVRRIPLGGD